MAAVAIEESVEVSLALGVRRRMEEFVAAVGAAAMNHPA